jgi:hypothetical protein
MAHLKGHRVQAFTEVAGVVVVIARAVRALNTTDLH